VPNHDFQIQVLFCTFTLPATPNLSQKHITASATTTCFPLILMPFADIVSWLFCSDYMYLHFYMCGQQPECGLQIAESGLSYIVHFLTFIAAFT